MSWKERISPSNNAESGCYKIAGAIGTIAILSVISPFLGPIGKLFFIFMIGFGLLNFIAWSYIRKVKNNYETSSIIAYFVGLSSIFVTIIVYFSMFVVIMLFVYIVENFIAVTYSYIYDFAKSITFFALMIFIAFLIGKPEPRITRFFAERVWHLTSRDLIDTSVLES